MTTFKNLKKKRNNTLGEPPGPNETNDNLSQPEFAPKNPEQPTPFLLKLEQKDHEQLKLLAAKEERSMQWILRKLVSVGIAQRAREILE